MNKERESYLAIKTQIELGKELQEKFGKRIKELTLNGSTRIEIAKLFLRDYAPLSLEQLTQGVIFAVLGNISGIMNTEKYQGLLSQQERDYLRGIWTDEEEFALAVVGSSPHYKIPGTTHYKILETNLTDWGLVNVKMHRELPYTPLRTKNILRKRYNEMRNRAKNIF